MELSPKQQKWVEHVERQYAGNLVYGGDDLGFTWHSCDLCNSPLGGDRYSAHVLNTIEGKTEVTHDLEVCTDCIMYIANGDVPDDEYIKE